MRHAALILLASFASAPALRGGQDDLECKKRDLSLNQTPWLYNMPDAAGLPGLEALAADGGMVLLDESVHNRGACQYSFMGLAGTAKILGEMGSVSMASEFYREFHINARARLPDGRIINATEGDITCSLVRNTRLKYLLSDRNLPKRFVVTLPGLQPGSLIQYQVTFPCDSHGLTYPNFAPMWNGFQQEYMDGDAEELGWTYLPAANLRMIVMHDKGIDLEAKVIENGSEVKVENLVTPNGVQHYMRVSTRRPARKTEEYTPPLAEASPLVLLRRVFPGEKSEATWDERVRAFRKDWLKHTDPDSDLLELFLKSNPVPAEADGLAFARAVNLFIRDKIKYKRDFRAANLAYKPRQMVKKPDAASAEEHMYLFVALLRSRKVPCRVVIYRSRYQPEPIMELPSIGWLHGYVIEVATPAGPVYFNPFNKIAGGRLIDDQYEAKAIAVNPESGAWEWTRLPAERAADNEVEFRVEIRSIEGGSASGELTATLRGRIADRWRRELRGERPADRNTLLRDMLEMTTAKDPAFSEITTEHEDDIDKPLVVRAKYQQQEFLATVGARKLVFPSRLLPRPADGIFASRPRMFPILFRTPVAYRSETVIPIELLGGEPAPQPDVEFSEGDLRYRRSVRIADGKVIALRELDQAGRFPREQVDRVEGFFLKVAAADRSISLSVPPPPAAAVRPPPK